MAAIDRVKWDGGPNVLAWKFPSDELSTFTQLIVNETQEAFVVTGGVYEGPFGGGRHTLSTENLPVLRSVLKLPFGGQTPFSAEVWFVNRITNLDVKWGTADPIQVQDPKYGLMIPVRSFGQYGIRVKDSKRFLLKLVGAVPSFDADTLASYFRGVFITRIKTLIATAIVKQGISFLEISTALDALSETLRGTVSQEIAEFGVELTQLNIHSISVDESDSAVAKLKDALARKAEMSILDFDYRQQRSFDVLEAAAGNEGAAGAVMGLGLGAGAGAGLGLSLGRTLGDLSGVTSPGASHEAPPEKSTVSAQERIQMLRDLMDLRHQGLLNEEELAREKARILAL